MATNRDRFNDMRTRCLRRVLWGLVAIVPLCSEAQTNRFFYDALGRLGTVLDATGTNAAIYQYDAVGNITGIVRKSVGAVNLFYFTPDSGYGNQTVTLQGTGFSATPSQNTVVFGTVTATVVSASANVLKVLVPTNAVTSQISVNVAGSGGNTNTRNFTVGIGVEVIPSTVLSSLGPFTTQFVARVYGTNSQSVTWNLNGWVPAGSNTEWGLVTTNGLYTSPANPPRGNAITVRARSVTTNDPALDGVATVSFSLPLGPIYSPTVSAQPGLPTILGPIYSHTISVGTAPVAKFTTDPTNGFTPLSVTFTDNSTGTIDARSWSFGDGETTNTSATSVLHPYVIYPPGDVNRDGKVTGADSLLINQVVTGLRATNDAVFLTNFTAQLIVSNALEASTNTCAACIQVNVFPNGDVNQDGLVTGADSLLINQVAVDLRSHVVTKTVPGVGTNTVTNAVTVYGIGYNTGTVTSVDIAAPVSLMLSNMVPVNAERITGIVPVGGGVGTGLVTVAATDSNNVANYANYLNQ